MNSKNTLICCMLAVSTFAFGCSGNPSAANVPTPVVTTISPSVGSTAGGTPLVLAGSGFVRGMAVSFDGGAPIEVGFDTRYTDRVSVAAPPHAVGTVDILATNLHGASGRFPASYTYVTPDNFDFTGTWWGFPLDGSDLPIEFTIQNNTLISASCNTTVISFATPIPVIDGAFAFSQDGSTMTGKIVSASQAVGDIALAPCKAPLWNATRKP